MAAKSIFSSLLLLCFAFNAFKVVKCWDQIDLELFDLVDEIKDNFYGILGVEQVNIVYHLLVSVSRHVNTGVLLIVNRYVSCMMAL